MCVYLQYWKHKEHIFADLYIQAKKSSISKKEKRRLIGTKLVVSVIWSAGPVELPVEKKKKGCVFLWFRWIQLQLPASPFSAFAQRAFGMRKLSLSARSELWTSSLLSYSLDKLRVVLTPGTGKPASCSCCFFLNSFLLLL